MSFEQYEQEGNLNEKFHDILERVGIKKEDLRDYWIRNSVIVELKQAMKETGFWTTDDDYKLPLAQCETCGAKEHCLKTKPRSCPNFLGKPQERVEHIKKIFKEVEK